METKHDILINSKQGVQYKIHIIRKITIIRGESATGKSTLCRMVSDGNSKQNVGISISCDVPVKTLNEDTYQRDLDEMQGNIFVIDEDFSDLKTKEFAKAVNKSSNCFIIITREALPGIPYSYKEIYEIKCSGKFHSLNRLYGEFETFEECNSIITEDEDAGLQYYQFFYGEKVMSSFGNSNLIKYAQQNRLIIGDGSAIGAYIEDLLLSKSKLFFPESFEWLLLNSRFFSKNSDVLDILKEPEEYVSTDYVSWERYFTELIIKCTKDTPAQYAKAKINEYYLNGDSICK